MKLTDEQLSKFQELYFKNFGTRISKEEALEQGIKLITLIKRISTTLNKTLYDKRSNNS